MKRILFFLTGLIVMGLVDLCVQCDLSKISDYINLDEDPVDIDYKAIESIAKKTEAGFASGNINEVKELMDPDALDWYGDRLNGLSNAQLASFGYAFKTRELTAATEMFAEYTFTNSGQSYTVTFWKGSEKSWLMVRF